MRGADEAIFLPREGTLKRTPDINIPDQTTGIDHVGHHHQLNLPPVLQELRRSRAQRRALALRHLMVGVASPLRETSC
jgi:hypothetical protein